MKGAFKLLLGGILLCSGYPHANGITSEIQLGDEMCVRPSICGANTHQREVQEHVDLYVTAAAVFFAYATPCPRVPALLHLVCSASLCLYVEQFSVLLRSTATVRTPHYMSSRLRLVGRASKQPPYPLDDTSHRERALRLLHSCGKEGQTGTSVDTA